MTARRHRRTRAKIEQLERQIYEVLAADYPQSIRHVFYRMTDPTLPEPVEKEEAGYRQIQERLTKMRRSGAIPYNWITDSTRRGYHVHTYVDAAEFLHNVASLYRGELWASNAHYIEVWTESRSIAGIIEADCKELAVSLYPAGGFSSITLAYQAAQHIRQICEAERKKPEIIYIGDFDPAGVLIDVAVEAEIRRHLPENFPLRFHRLALTSEQIATYRLPEKPRKAKDKRSPHVTKTVETEAMPAGILRDLLRSKVESFLPDGALATMNAYEQSEQQLLHGLVGLLEEGGP